ncbi:MAG: GTP cyclohydrolase I FolE2 [Deltaproteobacteria bacterium]|jgi:GTP cyclohydrolase I|nr:GTP cyclohydrolase I FolE2 [Deltaproteobacteria bacterium]
MRDLPDVQNQKNSSPQIFIEKVGVKNIKVNLYIETRSKTRQHVLATINSYCSLDKNIRGINMSRMARTIYKVLEENSSEIGINDFEKLVEHLRVTNNVDNIYIKTTFDYIMNIETPITKICSLEPVTVVVENFFEDDQIHNLWTVKTTEMSLCPCSKEMSLLKNNISSEELGEIYNLSPVLQEKIFASGFGAHNQKSEIQVTVEMAKNDFLWIEDIVDIVKSSVSAPTFSVLKRPDEKWVTEVSYLGGYWDKGSFFAVGGGPRFVEDIARNVTEKLNLCLDKKILDYIVIVNNHESIHSDNITATSIITAGRRIKTQNYL